MGEAIACSRRGRIGSQVENEVQRDAFRITFLDELSEALESVVVLGFRPPGRLLHQNRVREDVVGP